MPIKSLESGQVARGIAAVFVFFTPGSAWMTRVTNSNMAPTSLPDAMTHTRRQRRAVAAVLLALLVALGGIGCGGGSDRLSKSDYEKQVKQIGTDLQSSLKPLNSQNKDLGSLEGRVAAAQLKLQSASGRLRKLKAPNDAQADNTKLANGLSGLAREFNNLKQALASGDLAKVQQTANEFKTSSVATQTKAATEDLKKKGYDIGVFGT